MVKHLAPELMKDAAFRRQAKKKLNRELIKFTYTDGVPVGQIVELVESVGFDGTNLHGIYCGESGRTNETIGYGVYLTLAWYRMASGRYEIVAYVS